MHPNKETPEQELRKRAGSAELIEFMQSSGFKLTSSEHNNYGFWFNEKDQMTVGLVQAEYMFKLFATHYKAREAEIEGIASYVTASKLLANVGYLLEHRRQGALPEMTAEVVADLYKQLTTILEENDKYMRKESSS